MHFVGQGVSDYPPAGRVQPQVTSATSRCFGAGRRSGRGSMAVHAVYGNLLRELPAELFFSDACVARPSRERGHTQQHFVGWQVIRPPRVLPIPPWTTEVPLAVFQRGHSQAITEQIGTMVAHSVPVLQV